MTEVCHYTCFIKITFYIYFNMYEVTIHIRTSSFEDNTDLPTLGVGREF